MRETVSMLVFSLALALGAFVFGMKIEQNRWLKKPLPPERQKQYIDIPTGLPPGTIVVNEQGGLLFIPRDLGGNQPPPVEVHLSNSYVKRLYATPQGIVFPVWVPSDCGLMIQGGCLFQLFDEALRPILSRGVYDTDKQ